MNDQTAETPATEAPAPAKKGSIVPAKYAGRYKAGGSDELAKFINDQCRGKDGFNYSQFWGLCKLNGIEAAKVDHYAEQVASGRLGSQGRARMTLRNMLATIVRRDHKLKDLDGGEVALEIAPAPAVGKPAEKAPEGEATH